MSRKTLKRINSNKNKYVLGDVLGEGAFGQVREGMLVDEAKPAEFGKRVAVKIISRRLIKKVRNGDENLKREIRCIKLVKHENVIKLLEFINDEDIDKVYLVFELANLFSLQSLCELAKVHPIQDPITKVEEKQLPIPYIKILYRQLLAGLQACHSKGVVHRDIKPSNLQLTSDGKLKIIDFGVAETLDKYSDLDASTKFAGTPSFQPPEVAQGMRSFSATKVDIWAAGVTLYYMVEGSVPFKGDTVDDLYSKIGQGTYRMPERADDQLQSLIQGVLNPVPEDRLTLDGLLEHAWCDISSLDINLTEVLAELGKSDKENKTSLMKRYMEEEADSDEDEVSVASTGAEDHDGDQLDRERERRFGEGEQRSGVDGGNNDKITEINKQLRKQRRDALMQKTGQSCIVS